MVGLGFLKVFHPITRAVRPADERFSTIQSSSNSLPKSSISAGESTQSVDFKELHWDQQKLKAELYESLLNAFAQNNNHNLPTNETLVAPAAITNGFTKPLSPENGLPRNDSPTKSVTFKDHSHPSGSHFGTQMDKNSTPMKEGVPSVKTSPSIICRGLIHRKSSSIFNAVKTAFRNSREKPYHDWSIVGPDGEKLSQTKFTNQGEISSTEAVCGSDELSDGTTNASIRPKLPQEHARKASDKTILSEGSKDSTSTVCRWFSRHTDFPIATFENASSSDHRHPTLSARSKSLASLCATQLETLVASHRLSSDDSSLCGSQSPNSDSLIFESSDYVPPAVSYLPEYRIPQRLFSDVGLHSRQEKAFLIFNTLAGEHGYYRLVRPDFDPINFQQFIRPKLSKREIILRKVESVRSFLRPRSPIRNTPTLRRVRTITRLSQKYHTMDSLKGKTLETLGRLGGYSNLTLPGGFAPAVMRLPALVVSMVSYLRNHGPKSRNIFFEPGDITVASRIYDHFAHHILSAEEEKEKDTVDVTLRRSDFSSEVFGLHSDDEDFLRGRFHVLPVAWAFKHILAGIPGGILGAPRLYYTLLDISYRTFPDEPALPQTGYYGALPDISPTRARIISLAILALNNDIQLDFLCAIFGLCSLLDYETKHMLDFYRAKNVPPIGRAGLLTRKRILLTFTPLLCEETKGLDDEDFGCEAFVVMGMMLDYWRVISRQLHASDM